jgi:hypothetical protein
VKFKVKSATVLRDSVTVELEGPAGMFHQLRVEIDAETLGAVVASLAALHQSGGQ